MPSSTICSVAFRKTPSRCSEQCVLAARVGVVVVAEREVDGADAALLRGRAERRLVARAEGELADDVAFSTPSIALRSRSASSPPSIFDALAALERPRDRLLHLALEADPEHDAVDDGRPVREVLDRRERDLGPERQRAHHLAARLDRRHLERRPALDRDVKSVPCGGRDAALLLPLERRDGVLRPLGGRARCPRA